MYSNRKLTLIVALLIFACSGKGLAASVENYLEITRTKILSQISQQNYAQALNIIDAAQQKLTLSAMPADLIFYRAIVYSRQGQFQRAIEQLQIAKQTGYTLDNWHFEYALAAYQLGDYVSAQQHSDAWLTVNPNHTQGRYYAALIAYSDQRYQVAVEQLDVLLQLNLLSDNQYNNIGALYLRAASLMHLADYHTATAALTSLLNNPQAENYHNDADYLLGVIKRKQDQAKFWSLEFKVGTSGDSNTNLQPSDSALSDGRAEFNVESQIRPISALQMGYQLFSSVHFEQTDYDLLTQAVYASWSMLANTTQLSAQYKFDYSHVSSEFYLLNHQLIPALQQPLGFGKLIVQMPIKLMQFNETQSNKSGVDLGLNLSSSINQFSNRTMQTQVQLAGSHRWLKRSEDDQSKIETGLNVQFGKQQWGGNTHLALGATLSEQGTSPFANFKVGGHYQFYDNLFVEGQYSFYTSKFAEDEQVVNRHVINVMLGWQL